MIPGEIVPAADPVEINAGCEPTLVTITNTGPVPVHLTAHFHVFEANPRLSFDRLRAWGMRLDAPASGSVRFDPGQTLAVPLVPIGGARVVHGFNGAVNGQLAERDPREALNDLITRGFTHAPA